MTFQELGDIAKITGPVLSGLSIMFGVIYFVLNLKRDRAKQTLDYWEKVNQELKVEKRELLKDYGKKSNLKWHNLSWKMEKKRKD